MTTTKPIHGQHRPKDLPANAQDTPPVPCDFRVGDRVLYTNDYGVKFEKTVRGFTPDPDTVLPGQFIYIFTDAWWMPVGPESLKLIARKEAL